MSRRLPVNFEADSEEVKKAINVFDQYGYFRDRKRFLQDEINRLNDLNEELTKELGIAKKLKSTKDKKRLSTRKEQEIKENQIRIEQNKSRIHQIDFWGIRVTNKLGFRLTWDFDINGKKELKEPFKIEGTEGEKILLTPVPKWNWPITLR